MRFSVLLVAGMASGAIGPSPTDANLVTPAFAWSSGMRSWKSADDVALPGVAVARIARTCRMMVAPHPKGSRSRSRASSTTMFASCSFFPFTS